MNDHLLASVESRTNEYVRSRNPVALFGEQALADADALRRAALPSLSVTGLGRQSCAAAHVLGWFHYARFTASRDADNMIDFAQALFLFDANDSADDELPPALLSLLGTEAVPHEQIQLAHGLVEDEHASADAYALTVSIRLLDRAQAALPTHEIERAVCLSNLAHLFKVRFDHTKRRSDLQASVDVAKLALALIPEDHPLRPVSLTNLAGSHLTRFELGDDPIDLDASIVWGEQAAATFPGDHPMRSIPLALLGSAYRKLYERTNVSAHVDACIDRYERTIAASSTDNPERPAYLANLARAYLLRFDRLGTPEDLRRGIACSENALEVVRDHSDRALCLSDLASAYVRRFKHTQDPANLETAIEYGKQALVDLRNDPVLLSTLDYAYEKRFERTHAPADIQNAIDCAEQAIAAAQDPADRATYLSNLGLAHQTRYQLFGDRADLDASIDHALAAVADCPNDSHALPGLLANLVMHCLRRFERLGDLADVLAGIEHGQRALAMIPADHVDRGMHLSNLGVAYRTHYAHTGELAALRTGIDLAEQALAATPEDSPVLAGRSSNLAVGYQELFERTGEPRDLRPAIEYGEKAVAATPADHPDRGMYLSNVSNAYRVRFETGVDKQPADLAASIEYGEQAVAAFPAGHPRLGITLSNLGAAYGERFEHNRTVADLDAAVDRLEQAMAATPSGHPDRATCLTNLAMLYSLRFSGEQNQATAARLVGYLTGMEAASPMSQVRAARAVGTALGQLGAVDDAARALRSSVHALRAVAPRELNRTDQEHQLGGNPGLVSEAIAAHLTVGDTGGAVEVAELGRGILLSAAMDTRTELTELDEHAPELAAEFRSLRDSLNAADTDSSVVAVQRRELAEQWDRLLDRIRRQPGLQQFLVPPRLPDLQRAATDGTVVVLNVAPTRSDAILLRGDGINVVPLKGATLHSVREHTDELLQATRTSTWAGSLTRQRVVPRVLAWLWEEVVAPVLDALGHQESPTEGQQWPRIWWVPVGTASLLPLHAAGLPDGPAVLDRVVSSYAPTIRTLLHCRHRPRPRIRSQVTVAVPHAPGQPALPGTVAEAHALHARLPTTSRLLTDGDATTASMPAALKDSTWAHFACHARSDPAEPSAGGLLLHDAMLTLPQISGLRLDEAELVYLSACSTAQVRGHQADEAIHIASAFQLAGYRHVIATLWPIGDAVAAVAAHRFYELLPDSPNADFAPHALHRLAHELRAKHPDSPDLWAPFLHSGP